MDQAVYQWFLGIRSDGVSNAAIFWSSIWAPVCVWMYAALLGFISLLVCRHRQLIYGSTPLISVLVASTCSRLLKQLIGRQRPPEVTRLVIETSPAFPSGHSVAAAALAAAVLFFLRSRVLAVLLGVNALAVGLTRLYLGVHWLSDVLAGYALGILVVWMMSRVFRSFPYYFLSLKSRVPI